MRDKRKELKKVGEENMEIDGQRPGKKRRPLRNCLVMLSVIQKNVQKKYFCGKHGAGNDTAESGQQD